MAAALKSDITRKPEQSSDERIMSHEQERTKAAWRGLHSALCAAEADIIARKGPNWMQEAKP